MIILSIKVIGIRSDLKSYVTGSPFFSYTHIVISVINNVVATLKRTNPSCESVSELVILFVIIRISVHNSSHYDVAAAVT